jgi:hypothetical protein
VRDGTDPLAVAAWQMLAGGVALAVVALLVTALEARRSAGVSPE